MHGSRINPQNVGCIYVRGNYLRQQHKRPVAACLDIEIVADWSVYLRHHRQHVPVDESCLQKSSCDRDNATTSPQEKNLEPDSPSCVLPHVASDAMPSILYLIAGAQSRAGNFFCLQDISLKYIYFLSVQLGRERLY